MRTSAILATGLSLILAALGALPARSQQAPARNPDPWPRPIKLSSATVLMYQPQVERWDGNRLRFRAALAVKPNGGKDELFGVIWGIARTNVDRSARRVTLDDVQLTKTRFPTLADGGAIYLAELRERVPAAAHTIALDRLEASLAASQTVKPVAVEVKNDPPQIIVSYSPAILVPISGDPVLKHVRDSRFERIINTRALILREDGGTTFYLHVYEGWLSADVVDGPWTRAGHHPWGMDSIARKLAGSGQVDLLHAGNVTPKPSLAQGVPTIYVSHAPTELIVFKGQPNLQPVNGTALLWAANTTADVIVNTATNDYYVLISGRWYRAAGLNGPWSYVASNAVPPDFARIPPSSPAGVVLSTVAGTPQAQEAVIANSIPQTAAVKRSGPKFSATFDGAPQLRPIDGTPLQYVVNSSTPIIRVDDHTYYALRAGIWFSATSLKGQWVVAASVPAVIYTIPPSSALYYATYVRIYESTPTVVYEGYTPGYLGTVVEPDGTVVYGTGYDYQPWIGNTWYAPPATYGVQAQPVYNPAVGEAYGFALGLTTAAMADSYGSAAYYGSTYYGYPCCGSASADVYGHYGNTVTSGSRTWYDTSSGTVGETAGGSYTNYRTGTTGDYSASRSYDAATGQAQQGYDRTVTGPNGATGNVQRQEQYNPQTGRSGSSTVTGTGSQGQEVTSQRESGANAQGVGTERTTTVTNPQTGASHTTDTAHGYGSQGAVSGRQTTYTNPNTGKTETYGAGHEGNNVYADHDGNVYKNTGSGWQQHTSNGWQDTNADSSSWQQREQQARSQGDDRFNSFNQGGGGWASRSGGGGGWANRFGGGGGFGGGGFGDRFGGGGFGGRFGGGFGGGRRW